MEKKVALQRWHDIPENQPILPHFTPIAADAKGSTFGACGIRISGNPEFIDAVLSRLKDLLAAEAGSTRLSLARNAVKPVFDKQWGNADTDAETCYIQIRERTAKTRQRKVRAATAPLFKEDAEGKADIPPITPAVLPDSFNESTPAVKAHPKPRMVKVSTPDDEDNAPRLVHFGGEGGEVIWDDED